MAQFSNKRDRVATYIRPGGPGNAWKLADAGGAMVDAPSGGGVGFNSRFGVDGNGNSVYLGATQDGDQERFTSTISVRPDIARYLQQLAEMKCPFDLAALQRCNDLARLNYDAETLFYDAGVTSISFAEVLANLAEGGDQDQMLQREISAAPFFFGGKKLRHDDVSGTTSDFDFNWVISLGVPSCPGDCGVNEDDGESTFFAVTDRDSTPGYLSQAVPKWYYTTDKWATYSTGYINVFTTADATHCVKAGQYILVASPTGGVAYAKLQDLIDGVTSPWTLSTGFTSPTFPRTLFAVDAQTVWAAGTGGNIWKSTDGGGSFSSFSAGTLTTNQLNSISFVNANLGYFVGNSGTFLRYSNGALTLIAVSDGTTTVSANLTTVRTAFQREKSVFVATANGQIWRNDQQGKANKWSNKAFPGSGTGSVTTMEFGGWRGDVLFVVHTDPNGLSRVLRDLSGGALGLPQVEVIGEYTDPSNFGINSIAPANRNVACCVGQIHQTYAFVGMISGQ